MLESIDLGTAVVLAGIAWAGVAWVYRARILAWMGLNGDSDG